MFLFVFFTTVLNVMQTRIPQRLPKILRNWNFLPSALRSLEPYDRILKKIKCKSNNKVSPDSQAESKEDKNNILMAEIQSVEKITNPVWIRILLFLISFLILYIVKFIYFLFLSIKFCPHFKHNNLLSIYSILLIKIEK